MQTNEESWIWEQLNLSAEPHTADMKDTIFSNTEQMLCTF